MSDGDRPDAYDARLASEICRRLAAGQTLRRICEAPGMPSRATVLGWLFDPDAADFPSLYTRARRAQAEGLIDEILELADAAGDGDVAQAKLQIEARKWVASRLLAGGEDAEDDGTRTFTIALADHPLPDDPAREGTRDETAGDG